MSWFSKLFGKDEDDFEIEFLDTEFPASTLLRWFIYDVGTENQNDLSEFLGLNRVSDEGDAKEQEDSDKRIIEIKELLPYIDYISTLSADVITAAQLRILREGKNADVVAMQQELEEDLKIMRDIYRSVAASTLIGAISIAVRLGVLEQGDVALEEMDFKGDENE